MILGHQVQVVMGVEGITPQQLEHMLRSAAVVTHERGNRRYHNWLFHVEDENVETMQHFHHVVQRVPAQSTLTVHEQCDSCEGIGCKDCGYIGEVCLTYGPVNFPHK